MAISRGGGRGTGESPANVTKNLKGMHFPASKKDLIQHAQHEKAESVVMSKLQNLEDREYQSITDVMKGYGKEQREAGKGRSSSTHSGKH
ncbi:DUF2795 domain-containing protein [Geobacter sp. SVR]|uniref:DUF2795 domain-containing protein n=1 Tax=Geobacter sp. SVR TaxID=2495594 RepID=UPI00143EF8EF|nr:DUF2795 domain-containing protein [Geobacter sp. SVR]BCS56057.1 hypothetical protein GSVR_43650 [Geobacter sp. SVR]GCF84820.1 hypothetical protein GSbR_14200 [Geobacter sp. SVR]